MTSSLNITVHKILISALLLTTITDTIKGFSVDIFVPIVDAIVPGDIRRPINIFGTKLYITRFIIRVINLIGALLAVRALQQNTSQLPA